MKEKTVVNSEIAFSFAVDSSRKFSATLCERIYPSFGVKIHNLQLKIVYDFSRNLNKSWNLLMFNVVKMQYVPLPYKTI